MTEIDSPLPSRNLDRLGHAGRPGRRGPDSDREGRIDVAYPFSAIPTPFVVVLASGEERYACCAIDALGMAAMVGQRVHIPSRCHDCCAPLELSVAPDGPASGAEGVLVWVGKQAEGERRALTSL